MEKNTKTVLVGIVGFIALLVSAAVFHHYIISIPNFERQRIASAAQIETARQNAERAIQNEREAARKQIENEREQHAIAYSRQANYESCKASALANYQHNWAANCDSAAQERIVIFWKCRTAGLNPAYCNNMYGNYDASAHCSLPKHRADSVNATYRDAQAVCLAEARLGL